MTSAECEAILAKLFAGFPYPPVEPITVEVYAEFIEPLGYEQCVEAVNTMIRDERYRPAVATFLQTYRSLHDKYAPKALRMPPVTKEERNANIAQLQQMYEQLGWGPSRKSVRDVADEADRMDD